VIAVLATSAILRDRTVTLATAEARTRSFARPLTIQAETMLVARAAAARQRAELRAMLVREVDHRVRNPLRLFDKDHDVAMAA
jgi:hypothetical protein